MNKHKEFMKLTKGRRIFWSAWINRSDYLEVKSVKDDGTIIGDHYHNGDWEIDNSGFCVATGLNVNEKYRWEYHPTDTHFQKEKKLKHNLKEWLG